MRSLEALQDFRISRRGGVFALFSFVLLLLGSTTIQKVIELAWDRENIHASHILAVPFVCAWLIWTRREAIFRDVRYFVVPGLGVVAIGGFMLLVAKTTTALEPSNGLSLSTASIVVMWLGGFLTIYGPGAFRTALFPLLFAFFAVPLPTTVVNWVSGILQSGSAAVAYALIKLSGMPIHRDGFVFTMPSLIIQIAPECSGIRSAIAIFLCSLIGGHLLLRSTWRKTLLVCIALPVLFFKNAIRIAALSIIAVHWDKRVMTGSLHTDGGILFFMLGLLFVYPFLALLMKSEQPVKA